MRLPHELPVLAICMDFLSAERGGVPVLVETLTEDLAEHFRIVLVTSDKENISGRFPRKNILAHLTWDNACMSREYCRTFAGQLVALGVEIAHFHGGNNAWKHRLWGYTPVSFLRRQGIRVFFTNHLTSTIWDGYGRTLGGSWFWRTLFFPVAWLGKLHFLQQLESEIAVSKHDLRLLERFYFPYKNRFGLIYHSRLSEVGAARAGQFREKIILSVGHVAFRKGQHVLVEACGPLLKNFPDWKLQIVGSNAEPACWTMIEDMIRCNGWQDGIQLLGERDDIIQLMERASIFVQPSIVEPLGLALQEALFHGCACIGTKTGGIPEMIDHGFNGFLVETFDVPALRRAVEMLLEDTTKLQEFSCEGRNSVLRKRMTRESMVKAYLSLYKSKRS